MTMSVNRTLARKKHSGGEDPRNTLCDDDAASTRPCLEDPRRPAAEESAGDDLPPRGDAFRVIDLGDLNSGASWWQLKRRRLQRARTRMR